MASQNRKWNEMRDLLIKHDLLYNPKAWKSAKSRCRKEDPKVVILKLVETYVPVKPEDHQQRCLDCLKESKERKPLTREEKLAHKLRKHLPEDYDLQAERKKYHAIHHKTPLLE